MSTVTRRRRGTLEIECLEGRLPLSGGLASIAHDGHPKGHHAEVETHKNRSAADHHATSPAHSPGADDPTTRDADDDKGGAGRHGGKDDGPGHK